MNSFQYDIVNRDVDEANLFIKNSRALVRKDNVEIAVELTDLRVQLEATKKRVEEVNSKLRQHKQNTVLHYVTSSLIAATLILLGISYILY